MHTVRSYKQLVILIAVLAAALFAAPLVSTDLAPRADAAVSKHCKNHTHYIVRKAVRDIPNMPGGAGRAIHARGGANPDYVMKEWFGWCYIAATDSARIWKHGVSARFPKGTDAARIGFQGVFGTASWSYSGGATRKLVKGAENDAYMRKVDRVNVSCEDGVVSNPGFENSCTYKLRIKGAWARVSDHEATRVGAFYYR